MRLKVEFDTQQYCFWLPQVADIIWAPGFKVVRAWWLHRNVTVEWIR